MAKSLPGYTWWALVAVVCSLQGCTDSTSDGPESYAQAITTTTTTAPWPDVFHGQTWSTMETVDWSSLAFVEESWYSSTDSTCQGEKDLNNYWPVLFCYPIGNGVYEMISVAPRYDLDFSRISSNLWQNGYASKARWNNSNCSGEPIMGSVVTSHTRCSNAVTGWGGGGWSDEAKWDVRFMMIGGRHAAYLWGEFAAPDLDAAPVSAGVIGFNVCYKTRELFSSVQEECIDGATSVSYHTGRTCAGQGQAPPPATSNWSSRHGLTSSAPKLVDGSYYRVLAGCVNGTQDASSTLV